MLIRIVLSRIVLYFTVFVQITGCTPNLYEAAAGEEIRISRTPTKITKAYKANENEVIICVEVKGANSENIFTYNFSIPLNSINKLKSFNTKTYSNLYYEPPLNEVRTECNYSKDELEIIEYETKDNISTHINSKALISSKVQKESSESVYVIYRRGVPVQLGYMRNEPIYNDVRRIDVPINSVYTYNDTINSRPYLYILTPVAVAFDIRVTLPAAAAFFTGYCLGDGDLDCH